MKKKMLALLLVVVMIMGSLSACGEKEKVVAGDVKATAAPAEDADADADVKDEAGIDVSKDTGKVLRIYCWNEEFQDRFNEYYKPNCGTNLDGIDIQWVITANKDNAYQMKLDETLTGQKSAAPDDKIDLFLVEADYALKYVNSDYTADVKSMGLTDADVANQYKYTQDIATNSTNGELRGVTWQATPGLFVYRRSIAKDVFGTDEPTEVQALLSDWDKFDAAAVKVNEKDGGKYTMLSGYDDAYRTFSNNVSAPWVSKGKVSVDPNIMKWVDQTKTYTDKGYNAKTSLWDDTWTAGQGPEGKVFGYFYSTWGIAFTLLGNSLETSVDDGGKAEVGNGIFGDWAACLGPESYYWGGTWICATPDSDNANLVADIMKTLTCDSKVMQDITKGEDDYTNNKESIQAIIDEGYSSAFLGGQDHISLLAEASEKIDMSNTSPYDQGCTEEFQKAFKDYFDGNVDKDKALANFYTAIVEKYPELTK